MIPNDTWAPGLYSPVSYPTYGLIVPSDRNLVCAVSVGPVALGAADGKLTSRFWMASQLETGRIFIQGEVGGVWGPPVFVFEDVGAILALGLTFDQNGRPIIFYKKDGDGLKLYWFNSQISQNEIRFIAEGITPICGFDYITEVNYQESDAWIFYARGNSVYSRLQRESWNTERLVKTYGSPAYVISAGYVDQGFFQLVVDAEGVCEILVQTLSFTDVCKLGVSVFSLEMFETFIPVDPDPPIIVDPDPPVIVDPPVVNPPTTPQGYYINKYQSGGWVLGTALLQELGGFAVSFKVKKEYESYGDSLLVFQGGYLQKSPTNQYYQSTFSIIERAGELLVTYRNAVFKCPKFWTGVVPKFKFRAQITKAMMCSVTFWKELPSGLGYDTPIVYNFPLPFTSTANPPFKTEPEEKLGIGCQPMGAFQGNTQCNTIIRDVIVELEDAFGFFNTNLNAPLNQWNVQYQSGFYNLNYKPQYWMEVTGA